MNRPKMTPRLAPPVILVLAAACGDTGREQFTVPLAARGTSARDVAVTGGTLRLAEASVSLGPLYLCATESAETELCETALAEWLDVDTFDALSQEPQRLGELEATTGSVRSGFFDYGISWLLTSQGPVVSEGAAGDSAELTFRATPVEGAPLNVQVQIEVRPLGPGDAAVNALRSEHELRPGGTLTLVVDPNAWLTRVRMADLIALDADGDGRVVLRSGDQAYEAILQGMTVNATPRLEWGTDRPARAE